MPKKYGLKEKDQVVAHIVNQILTGKLRTGDRVDRNEIAAELGMSRVPIQEAIVQLEHDGLMDTRYHRGAFVARFDADTIFEHFELHGVLTGMVAARAAADPASPVVGRLDEAMRSLRGANETRAFLRALRDYRRTINDEFAGPRLSAAIRASQNLIPRAFFLTQPGISGDLLPFYEDELAAIHRGDPAAAAAACGGCAELMAKIVVTELIRRGVFAPSEQRTAVL
jgi:DNA-binding GntR family transcriptional regulator